MQIESRLLSRQGAFVVSAGSKALPACHALFRHGHAHSRVKHLLHPFVFLCGTLQVGRCADGAGHAFQFRLGKQCHSIRGGESRDRKEFGDEGHNACDLKQAMQLVRLAATIPILVVIITTSMGSSVSITIIFLMSISSTMMVSVVMRGQ